MYLKFTCVEMAVQGKPDIWCKQEIGKWTGMGEEKSWSKQKTENKIKRPMETEFSQL